MILTMRDKQGKKKKITLLTGSTYLTTKNDYYDCYFNHSWSPN
jgi:hypothetical protein